MAAVGMNVPQPGLATWSAASRRANAAKSSRIQSKRTRHIHPLILEGVSRSGENPLDATPEHTGAATNLFHHQLQTSVKEHVSLSTQQATVAAQWLAPTL